MKLHASPGRELPVVARSSGALPHVGDVIYSINGESIEDVDDPFEEVMVQVNKLGRPIVLGFKPHPNPKAALSSVTPGVLSSTKGSPYAKALSPNLEDKIPEANDNSPSKSANKFDSIDKLESKRTAPVLILPKEVNSQTLSEQTPTKKTSAWNKVRGAVSLSEAGSRSRKAKTQNEAKDANRVETTAPKPPSGKPPNLSMMKQGVGFN